MAIIDGMIDTMASAADGWIGSSIGT